MRHSRKRLHDSASHGASPKGLARRSASLWESPVTSTQRSGARLRSAAPFHHQLGGLRAGLLVARGHHLVYVPGYARWVVTASQDSDDGWGCTDQAIGYFGGGGERLARAGAVIRAYWQRRRSECDCCWPWAYLFDGLVSKKLAEH
jgi:hypothetical protein